MYIHHHHHTNLKFVEQATIEGLIEMLRFPGISMKIFLFPKSIINNQHPAFALSLLMQTASLLSSRSRRLRTCCAPATRAVASSRHDSVFSMNLFFLYMTTLANSFFKIIIIIICFDYVNLRRRRVRPILTRNGIQYFFCFFGRKKMKLALR